MNLDHGNSIRPRAPFWLRAALVVNGVAIAVAAWYAAAPLAGRVTNAPAAIERLVPDYDFTAWRSLPVQDGRTRPFGTYCEDTLRQITGRSRFAGYDATGIVLTWMLGDRGHDTPGPWETQPFILGDHRDLRAAIYKHVEAAGEELTPEQRQGKYISPADLRSSPGFDELLANVGRARKELGAKAHFRLSTAEIKAEEVAKRLVLYDVLRGHAVTRLYKNALAKGQYFDLAEFAAAEEGTPSEALARVEARLRPLYDPLHLVILDQIPGSEWLSLGQMETLLADPKFWPALVEAHIVETQYLRDTYAERGRKQSPPLDAAQRVLSSFHAAQEAFRSNDPARFAEASQAYFNTLDIVSQEADVFHPHKDSRSWYPGVTTIPAELWLADNKPFRWAWVTMLLALVLLSLSAVSQDSLNAPLASSGVPLASPMRGASVRRLDWLYSAAMLLYLISLAWQTAGFALRMSISGFAPVSNMYESVIFAAYVAVVLGVVLEAIYRRRVIALAAAGVATFGLVLADQLPLALDPKISPIVPVLRTNYWLTIHVLTIVASYAAATLAWGLGNLSLGLLAFGRPRPETLKMLSLYIYRALQVAVLLLATGTLLGGWWAAESWGRFWGWDPKEVGALIALVCYVVPLHARYIGWVRDFGLAVAAVVCYAAIILSWYVVNFVLAAGLHSYGFSSGGSGWVILASLVNVEWVLLTAAVYGGRVQGSGFRVQENQEEARSLG